MMAKPETEQADDKVDIDDLTEQERQNASRKIQEEGIVDFVQDTFEMSYEGCLNDDDEIAWATLHHYRRTLIDLIAQPRPDLTLEEICSWLIAVGTAAASLSGITTALFDAYASGAPADVELLKVTSEGVNMLKRALDEDLKEVSVAGNEEAN
jgi:hypothetical protein